MHPAADRIRNVALVGHRGAGKTTLHEALLYEAGVTNRLGTVPDGTTVSDSDPDEQSRQRWISAALSSFDWHERRINLLDTPGEPSFVADALGALRVCESAIFVVNAVMGVEGSTSRLWARAAELDIARMLFVNMLDRERADFFRTLDQLKKAFGSHVVATEIPIGAEHEIEGIVDLVDMKAYRQESAERGGFSEMPIPDAQAELAREYREKLMDEVCEVSDALMERYLEGQEISHDEVVGALKEGTNHGNIFPVVCGVATRNLGTSRLLDAIVEDLPSPVKHGALRVGELELAPVMAFAVEPKSRGDEEKVFASLRRLQEEDPTIDLHRDQQTGDQIVAGLSQVHVEVIVDRLRERFGVEVTLKPPRVPYRETIRSSATAHGRHKKQSGGRGQFGDCHIEVEPLADIETGDGFEFVDKIKGGVIPSSFIPAVEKGVREAMDSGVVAGYPVKGVRVRLFDGQYHTVDSSEIAFKLAGIQAMKQALEQADPVLLEPIMLVTLSVPESYVGDVIGDLNSRRGRPQGMEPSGAMTEIKAEVPMAEMLTYAPDLRSITGGQGDYTLEFLRYEEIPAHLAQKVVEQADEERAATHA